MTGTRAGTGAATGHDIHLLAINLTEPVGKVLPDDALLIQRIRQLRVLLEAA